MEVYRLCLVLPLLFAGASFAADTWRPEDLGLPPPALGRASADVPAIAVAPQAVEVCFAGRAYRRLGDLLIDDQGATWRALRVTTTAYVPVAEQCDGNPDRTSIGKPARTTYGVAADPRALGYGTKLRIPGYGDVSVDDTGGGMRQAWQRDGTVHLDLRIPFRRADGVWRDAETCNRIARAHGVQRDRVVLVRVPEDVVAIADGRPASVVP